MVDDEERTEADGEETNEDEVQNQYGGDSGDVDAVEQTERMEEEGTDEEE